MGVEQRERGGRQQHLAERGCALVACSGEPAGAVVGTLQRAVSKPQEIRRAAVRDDLQDLRIARDERPGTRNAQTDEGRVAQRAGQHHGKNVQPLQTNAKHKGILCANCNDHRATQQSATSERFHEADIGPATAVVELMFLM